MDISNLSGDEFDQTDIIKFISKTNIDEHKAISYDWIVYDADNNMRSLVPRAKHDEGASVLLEKKVDKLVDSLGPGGAFGVSLGPVAVSYDLLEIFSEVFGDDILKDDVTLYFDPEVLEALCGDSPQTDLATKVKSVRDKYRERHGRELKVKVFDLGDDLCWMDMGNHVNMREKYMLLTNQGPDGDIARSVEGIESERDDKGNIIINSFISEGTFLEGSVVIDSRITGTGTVKNSVIKKSCFTDVDFKEAFAVNSDRKGYTELGRNSGLYSSYGKKGDDFVLSEGMRHGTILTEDGPVDMMVSEKIDLKDKNNYEGKILGNKISFKEAASLMTDVSDEDLNKRIEEVKNG